MKAKAARGGVLKIEIEFFIHDHKIKMSAYSFKCLHFHIKEFYFISLKILEIINH